jgi:hypothetical protein
MACGGRQFSIGAHELKLKAVPILITPLSTAPHDDRLAAEPNCAPNGSSLCFGTKMGHVRSGWSPVS